MSVRSQPTFDAQELTIALAVAVLAQLLFLAIFSLPSPKLVEADISNENARAIAVAITPVLKLGSKAPSAWQRKRPPAVTKTQAPQPSPLAAKTPEAVPTARVVDASAPWLKVDAAKFERAAPAESSSAGPAAAAAASTEGAAEGAVNGTETDPLKARAVDAYRDQLLRWFQSRFHIRGKIPFEQLRHLRAHATVVITPDRTVGSFSIDAPSGDPSFDAEVTATLSQIQASGIELPAPPPLYPDILHSTLPVGFACSIQKACE